MRVAPAKLIMKSQRLAAVSIMIILLMGMVTLHRTPMMVAIAHVILLTPKLAVLTL